MKKYELQDGSLDELGRKLLEAGRVQDDELEKIVSAPHLLSGIKNRVKAEQRQAAASAASLVDWRTAFSFLARPNMAAAFGALLIAVVSFGGFYIYSRQMQGAQTGSGPVAVNAVNEQSEKSAPVVTRQEVKPVTVSEVPLASVPAPEERAGEVKATTAFYHPAAKPATALKVSYRKNSTAGETAGTAGEFYPLTYTGGSNEIAPGAQIVRVELPRASLFSMGVDLPDDDRTGTVKADLLISADGVTRGFRLVK